MKKYTHLFFDLDHTLWDTEKNSEETLLELIDDFDLYAKGIDNKAGFLKIYHYHNNSLWEAYSKNQVPKEQVRHLRFLRTFEHFNIRESALIERMSDEFVKRSPYKKNLIPQAMEILQYLQEKQYHLYVITNGFREVQHIKIANTGLDKFFKKIFISEEVGFLKPQKEIFQFALEASGCCSDNALMIGDNFEVDISGASNAGIDTVFYNPSGNGIHPDIGYEIKELVGLKSIL